MEEVNQKKKGGQGGGGKRNRFFFLSFSSCVFSPQLPFLQKGVDASGLRFSAPLPRHHNHSLAEGEEVCTFLKKIGPYSSHQISHFCFPKGIFLSHFKKIVSIFVLFLESCFPILVHKRSPICVSIIAEGFASLLPFAFSKTKIIYQNSRMELFLGTQTISGALCKIFWEKKAIFVFSKMCLSLSLLSFFSNS